MKEKNTNSSDIRRMLAAYGITPEIINNIETEELLQPGLIDRLHRCFPEYSGFSDDPCTWK